MKLLLLAAVVLLVGCFSPGERSTGRLSMISVAYQFEPEAEVIFASGFETGDTSEWEDEPPTVEIEKPVEDGVYKED